jgi:hypothetical protein
MGEIVPFWNASHKNTQFLYVWQIKGLMHLHFVSVAFKGVIFGMRKSHTKHHLRRSKPALAPERQVTSNGTIVTNR